jgi:CubicO group peptidase (beta-lactamase class C family)
MTRAMISRRRFITGASGTAVLIATGCTGADGPASVGPATSSRSSETTSPVTAPATTAPVTTTPATLTPETITPATTSTSPAAMSPVGESWSGADFAGLDQFLEQANTNAFRIVERGVVVHEWYRTDETFVRDIASAQKSVLSLLVGRAIGDAAITLDTPIDDVLATTWTPHGRTAEITVRHLLAMTSGLDDRFAVIAEPGAEWHYSGAFAALFDVLTTVTGRDLNELADDWLFGPAGATTAEFYERRTNQFAPVGLLARASDLTAIGQVVLDTGSPAVTADWLDDSFTPSSAMNDSYGYLWWLNGQDSFRLPGARVARTGGLIPSAPPDLVAALGKDDQKLYISRDLGLVVARLGAASGEVRAARSSFDDTLWQRLLELRSA